MAQERAEVEHYANLDQVSGQDHKTSYFHGCTERNSLLLDKVQIDIAAGKLVRPPGDSAYSAYQQIVALEPDNLQARAVLQRLVQLHLDGSEQALRQEKLQEASVWLDDLAMIAPDNQNLSRLRSELRQAQVKVQRRDARIASLLDRARALEERDDAEQRRDLYLQVIEIDPRNSTARKGLARTEDILKQSEIQQRKQAEDAAAARFRMAKQLLDEQPPDPGNFELAQRYLLEAQSLSPGFAPVTDLIREMPLRYIRVIRNSISAEEYKQAEAFIRPAMTLSPQDSTLLGLQKELTDLVREQEQLMLPASF